METYYIQEDIVLGTKLARRQIRSGSFLKGASDLIEKHTDILKAMIQAKYIPVKANSVNKCCKSSDGSGAEMAEIETRDQFCLRMSLPLGWRMLEPSPAAGV